MEIKDKIRVFISSKCGIENYDIIREALKRMLDDTGIIDAYVFESSGAYSHTAAESYLGRLDDCDVVLFLIDNEDSIFPEGVMKEWVRARDLGKKSIYLFFNSKTKNETTIQKSLYGPNRSKFLVVNNIKEFLEKGYTSVIDDIFITYKDYCRGRLNNKIELEESDNIDNNENNIMNQIQTWNIKKDILNQLNNVKWYFKNKNPFYIESNITLNNETEEYFSKFIKVLLYEKSYNRDSMDLLVKLVGEAHPHENRDIILKKWESIINCYENNIPAAIECLRKAYEYALSNGTDKWIINDILIDKRNLENLLNEENNIIAISDAQKIINNNDDMLYYPVLDRISKEIYENITKEINKVNMSTPYSTQIGTNIETILEDISEYYIFAVYYGSYTHIKLVIKLLEDVFYNFYKIYEENRWGFEALKYAILNSNSKVIKDICDRNSKVVSACSTDKINELYILSDRISRKYEKNKLKINTFKHLAYYFEENDYIRIEKDIFTIFNEWLYSENSSVYLGQLIFESIKTSIHRINKEKVLDLLITVIHKKYYRFFDDLFEILAKIKFDEIIEYKFNELVDTIVDFIKNKTSNKNFRYLKKAIVNLRKCKFEYSNILDEVILSNWEKFYDEYKLELSEEEELYSLVYKYLEEIKNRNLTQGNGSYVGYGYNPQNIIRNIIKYSDIDVSKENLIELITEACRECLINRKQVISEKISSIQLLLVLKYICENRGIYFDWKKYNESLNENDVLEGYSDCLFNKETKLTLMSNYTLYKISNKYAGINEALELFVYYNHDIYENIRLVEAMNIFIENNEFGQFKEIYPIFIQFIAKYVHDKNYEIRCKIIILLFTFINKVDNGIIIKYINIISDDPDYRVKLSILKNIEVQEDNSVFMYREILEKYMVDNHYLVRTKSKKLLDKLELKY